jgi:hypothetical protein
MDCILYFGKELDFLFIGKVFSLASAATICRKKEFLGTWYASNIPRWLPKHKV